MILRVMSYNATSHFHTCIDEQGKKHQVDLMIDKPLPGFLYYESLIGKTVEIDGQYPYITIAHGVRVLD